MAGNKYLSFNDVTVDSVVCWKTKLGEAGKKFGEISPGKTSAKLKSLTSLRNPVHSLTASGAT